jgi:hypothetical protein
MGRLRAKIDLQITACTLAALVLVSPVQAAVFSIAAGDVTALINAINTANGNNEEDTINLAAGTYTLTAVDNDTDGPNGLPSITSTITIRGTGANRTVLTRADTAPELRILQVAATGVLTLDGLTVSGAPFFVETFNGGISNRGTLMLLNSTISDAVVGFRVDGFAGGVTNTGGKVTLLNSTVSGNQAENGPGGISNDGGTVTLLNSTVTGNSSSEAGGIGNNGLLTVVNSTISHNGGEAAGGIGNGGTVTLLNSTITDNTVFGAPHDQSGGILNEGGTIALNNSIILGNGEVHPVGSEGEEVLIRGNECVNAFNPESGLPLGQITSLGHNLGCTTDGPGDLTADPAKVFTTVLGPLQNNGGPTQTHALLPGSPAIDAGAAVCTDASGTPLTTDQRGKPRPIDGNRDGIRACDIGAFEFFPTINNLVTLAPGLKTSFNATPVAGLPAGTFTITATFTNKSSTPLHALFFGVSQLTGGNLLLNADAGPAGVGATLTPKISGDVLALGASVTVEFVVGLQKQGQFTFFVNVFGEPVL